MQALTREHYPRVATGLWAIELLATAVWAGGLVTLGACVAPVVFRAVPWPTNADAMTLVFHKFDAVACACGAAALSANVGLALLSANVTRTDKIRTACLVLALTLAGLVALWLAPAIATWHAQGVRRGVGEAGLALAKAHRLAEALAKSEAALLLATFVSGVAKMGASRSAVRLLPSNQGRSD